jgi:CRISPR-associated endonuclease/helicase Cas3
MSNSIEVIESFLSELRKKEYQDYYAHISGDRKETLYEHTELTYKYFQTIIDENKLNLVIENLITDFTEKNYKNENIISAKEFVKALFFSVPVFHDLGKLNPNFQLHKMQNNKFHYLKNSLSSKHSKISAFIFLHKFISSAIEPVFSGEEKIRNLFLLYCFSYPIKKHHSPIFEYDNEYDFSNDFISDVIAILPEESFLDYPEQVLINIGKKIEKDVLNKNRTNNSGIFSLFALLKLNYSLLTASDYYATSHFINDWDEKYNDFGLLNGDLKTKIIEEVQKSKSYNKKAYEVLDSYIPDFPTSVNGKNLNKLRQNLSIEVIKGIRKNIDENLFYLEAPTGGGKTNLSILSIAEFLRNDVKSSKNEVLKIFYVFPFTALITQTFQVVKDTLGLNTDEIVQIHSKSGFSEKNDEKTYGEKKDNIIDYQFVNYPIALISHVKFFNILKSNKKSDNYLLHRIANSIVIIDELQAYSPKEWDKVVYFINNYSKLFNIKFLLMSATLPKIDKLLFDTETIADLKDKSFCSLNPEKEKYFINPNFKNRVEFDFAMLESDDFLKEDRDIFLTNLWAKVVEESSEYRVKSKSTNVHTIIEFIFKQTASEFFENIKNINTFFDEIFILSGTILEPRRREIISKLKSEQFKSKNILLLTTQVIEAGVDIDMDIGFKDKSLIDSDEQLAGRINRNVEKSNCKLFLFDLDDEKLIYGNDYRYEKIQTSLKDKYFSILENKSFDLLYDSVMVDRNKFNKSSGFVNMKSYISKIKKLDFYSIDKDFKLIDDEIKNVSIFVPLNIPVKIAQSNEENFSEEEQAFLEANGKFTRGDESVCGFEIWDLYEEIIKNKEKNFNRNRKMLIIIQGLIAKFSFSISIYSKFLRDIIISGNCEEKYGFLFLQNHDAVYSYEEGVKSLNFQDTNIW